MRILSNMTDNLGRDLLHKSRISLGDACVLVWVNCALFEHIVRPLVAREVPTFPWSKFIFSHPKVDPGLVSAWQAP